MSLYQIELGPDQFNPEIRAICDLDSCFKIYWNYYCSVQSININFYVRCLEINSQMFVDITKGITYQYCDSSPIKCQKNHDYILDRSKTLNNEIL